MISPGIAGLLGEIAAVILVAIAAVHVFWALGGKLGKELAVPARAGGAGPAMRPRAVATLAVAVALVVAAALIAMRVRVVTSPLPDWVPQFACAALALVFLARAIGEFRYVGFFKRVRDSRFGRLDTTLYSPLCLFLAIAVGVNVW